MRGVYPGFRSGRKHMARAVSAARGEAERKEVGGWGREKKEASGALDDNRRSSTMKVNNRRMASRQAGDRATHCP